MKRLVKILGTVIFSLIIIIAIGGYLFVRNFDLNQYKSYVEDIVDKQLGRKLAINGNASVGISLIPTLVVEDVELSNAEWASQPQMAKIRRLEIKLSLLPLLHKQLVIDNVALIAPEVYLETSADGKNNWDFGNAASQATANSQATAKTAVQNQKAAYIANQSAVKQNPATALLAGFAAKNVVVTDGLLQYADAKSGKTTQVAINAFRLAEESMNDDIKASFDVVFDGQTIKGKTVLGSLNALFNSEEPYPFDITATAYGIDLTALGTARDLFGSPTYAAEINVYNPAGNMNAPETTLKTSVVGTLENIEANIAALNIVNNLITGTVKADISGRIPSIDAVLASDKINLQNFSTNNNLAIEQSFLIGTAEASPLVPETKIPYDVLKQVNARLNLNVSKLIVNPGMTAENVSVKADLQNGILNVNPLRLNFGGGDIAGTLVVNADTQSLKLDATSSNILLQNLHEEFQAAGPGDFGVLSGGNTDIKISLSGHGDTYRQLVQSLNGQVIGIVNESVVQTGSVSFLTGNFVSQLLNMMPFMKDSNKKLALNCAVVRADLGGGKAVFPKGIALQSDILKLVSNGSINLVNDKIDFDVRPSAGKIVDTNAVQALSSFIKIKGTLEDPKITLDDKAALKSVVGVALSGPAYLGSTLVNVDPAPCYTALQGTTYQNKFPAPTAAEKAATDVYNGADEAVDDSVKAVKDTVKGTAKELENTAKNILNMFKQPKGQ